MPNDSPPSAPDLPAEIADGQFPGLRARIGWSVAMLAFALVLLFGSIPLEAGQDAGERVRITALWAQVTDLLELRGLPASVVVIVWSAAAAAILATARACWLAQIVRDEPDRNDPDS